MSGTLFLVATPIGNLDDITLRAIKTLESVDFIAAEDTRRSLKLLNHLNISKPLISYHRHNENIKSEILIEKLLDNKNIALITDAGTPGISDPGSDIVIHAIENNIKITPIPGACAFINGLITSGLDTTEFLFLGFLPQNKKNRKEKLEKIKDATCTSILYEAPHKLLSTLKELQTYILNRKIVLAKELTKIHESFLRGTITELLEFVENPKGEYIILIDKTEILKTENYLNNLSLEKHFKFYENQGLSKNEIIKQIAKDRNLKKNEIYKNFI